MIVDCQGLLFDMDGVLISSIASVNRSWRKWAAYYGLPNADQVEIAHGTRAVELMMGFRPDFTPDDLTAGLRRIEDIEIADTGGLTVLPGVRALLASLPHERWSIVTSATRRLLLGRLKAAELPVPDRVIAADDVTNGKPHPEPYMTGARLLGFTSAECIVVEDAPTGVGSGIAAGSQVLGVLGTHTLEQLKEAGATWVVASLADVKVKVSGHGMQMDFIPI